MTVAWNPPEEDGGLEVSGYIIERKEVRSDRWVRANRNPITMTRYRSTELIEGLEYEHRVIALNAKGLSKPSLPSKPAVATDPIGVKLGDKDLILLSSYSQTKALWTHICSVPPQIHRAVLRTQGLQKPQRPRCHWPGALQTMKVMQGLMAT